MDNKVFARVNPRLLAAAAVTQQAKKPTSSHELFKPIYIEPCSDNGGIYVVAFGQHYGFAGHDPHGKASAALAIEPTPVLVRACRAFKANPGGQNPSYVNIAMDTADSDISGIASVCTSDGFSMSQHQVYAEELSCPFDWRDKVDNKNDIISTAAHPPLTYKLIYDVSKILYPESGHVCIRLQDYAADGGLAPSLVEFVPHYNHHQIKATLVAMSIPLEDCGMGDKIETVI